MPEASVVIASRDRPAELASVLSDLAGQFGGRRIEVIVVDDGTNPPFEMTGVPHLSSVRLVRTSGIGPARARNLGWEAARADIVMFTDDDVTLDARWVAAACDALEQNPHWVAAEGKVETPPYDPLYAYSVQADRAQMGLTCNVAYRRAVLVNLGGFFEGFPQAHCEDVDLVIRARARGRVGFVEDMVVTHQPRSMSVADFGRRGRMASSELVLMRRHRREYPPLVPLRALPVVYALRHWFYTAYIRRHDLLRNREHRERYLRVAGCHLRATFVAVIGRRASEG